MEYATTAKMSRAPSGSIFEEIEQADILTKELHQVVDELHARFGPVLKPLESPVGERLDQVRPIASDVRTRLGEHNSALHSARERLRELLERIEL